MPKKNATTFVKTPLESTYRKTAVMKSKKTRLNSVFSTTIKGLGLDAVQGDVPYEETTTGAKEAHVFWGGQIFPGYGMLCLADTKTARIPDNSILLDAEECVCAISSGRSCRGGLCGTAIFPNSNRVIAVSDELFMLTMLKKVPHDSCFNLGLGAYLNSSIVGGWVAIEYGYETLTRAILLELPCPSRENLIAISNYLAKKSVGPTGRSRHVYYQDIDDAVHSIIPEEEFEG